MFNSEGLVELKRPIDRKSPTSDMNLRKLVDSLKLVETDSAQAKLNETSISDNNGGRILL